MGRAIIELGRDWEEEGVTSGLDVAVVPSWSVRGSAGPCGGRQFVIVGVANHAIRTCM